MKQYKSFADIKRSPFDVRDSQAVFGSEVDIPDQKRSKRASMVSAGNPDVLEEAKDSRTVNGLTPTSQGTQVWRNGVMAGTPVQHSPGKGDAKDIGRPKPITY